MQDDVNALKAQVQKWIDDGELSPLDKLAIIWKGILKSQVTSITPTHGVVAQVDGAYRISASYSHYVVSTSMSFDMTNRKALKVTCRMDNTALTFSIVGCSLQPATTTHIDEDAHSDYAVWTDVNFTDEKTYTIDVSSLTGNYYVSFGLSNHTGNQKSGNNLYIRELWLE